MKQLLICLFVAMPLSVNAANSVPQSSTATVGMQVEDVGDFEGDVKDVSDKIRKLRAEQNKTKIWELLNKKRNPDYAQKVLEQLVRDNPELKEDCAISIDWSEIYILKGDYKKAYAQIDGAIRKIERQYPQGVKQGTVTKDEIENIAEAYITRGVVEKQTGDLQKAVSDLNKGFAIDPQAYMPLIKCRVLLQLKDYKEAAKAYDLAYKMNSKTAESKDKEYLCGEFAKQGIKPAACALKKI